MSLNYARFCSRALIAFSTVLALGMTACTSTYSADVRNQTPQVLFASASFVTPRGERFGLSSVRLGPGDRTGMGPFTVNNDALVSLTLDTTPNPNRPVIVDLRPGLTSLEVTTPSTEAASPLQVREIR